MNFRGSDLDIRSNKREAKFLVGPSTFSFVAGLAKIWFAQRQVYSLDLSNAADGVKECFVSTADDE